MSTVIQVSELLDGRPVREVERGLFSVLPADTAGQRYDRRARAYDRMIGSRLYNRAFWGSSPEQYREFARQAVASASSGWLLDAGCGTLLLTARAYTAAPHRPVVALDQSIGMLRRARERLLEVAAVHPDHIILLQADLLDLPFRAGCFQTVLSMGMLHLFEDPDPVLASLQRCLRPGGRMLLSSLVENQRFGDRYMHLLHRAGELARPRTTDELQRVLQHCLGPGATLSLSGNMSYAAYQAA
jgi:ubiquinone/menaquinone biosynthesis C-methylase UbiE